jgi:SAM-dependent methyltransferase
MRDAGQAEAAGTNWVPASAPAVPHPHLSIDFARVYERTASRITAPVAVEALLRAGFPQRGARVLDIAAGSGALSLPAAHGGASVLAVDVAPGMVELLSERLAPFPDAVARVMDGHDLAIDDDSVDLACSIFGVSLFADWRRGLREQARVVRPGGKAVVATWRVPPGGGPFLIMAQALRAVFPDAPPPAPPEGFVALADPVRLAAEMAEAGLAEVVVVEVEAVWQGQAGEAYLAEMADLHRYMGPYAALGADDARKVDAAILALLDGYVVDGAVRIGVPVLIAIGTKG